MRILKLNYKALRALLAVLIISVSTSGCTTKLAYDFLDWGLYWELKDYVKFTRDQRLLVRPLALIWRPSVSEEARDTPVCFTAQTVTSKLLSMATIMFQQEATSQ